MKTNCYLSKIKNIKIPLRNLPLDYKRLNNLYPYKNTNYWSQDDFNCYNLYRIGNLIKKLAYNKSIFPNKVQIQSNNNSIKLFVDNFITFQNYKYSTTYQNLLDSLKNNDFKKYLTKIAFSLIALTLRKSIKINCFEHYLKIDDYNSFMKVVFNKERFEFYYRPVLQLLELVFKAQGSSELLSRVIYTYTRRNPHRVRFLSFLKRAIEWYFFTFREQDKKLEGVRIEVKGRFNAKSRSIKHILSVGRIKKHKKSNFVDYKQTVAITKFGSLGIKVWICPSTISTNVACS